MAMPDADAQLISEKRTVINGTKKIISASLFLPLRLSRFECKSSHRDRPRGAHFEKRCARNV